MFFFFVSCVSETHLSVAGWFFGWPFLRLCGPQEDGLIVGHVSVFAFLGGSQEGK